MPAASPSPARIAIVTGASRGIGRAIVQRLARPGTALLLVAKSAERLADAVAQLQSSGAQCLPLALDLSRPDSAVSVRDAVLQRFGAVDVLVNCAGGARVGDFLDLTESDWSDGFALKLHGARRLCQALWPALAARHGSIVNIVGSAGRTPGADYALGGAVNAALLGLTKALAQRGIADGVQVNAINPGPTRTDRLVATLARRAEQAGTTVEEEMQKLVVAAGITRIGEADEVAALVEYVLSPAGQLLQGSLIDIDGGQTKSI